MSDSEGQEEEEALPGFHHAHDLGPITNVIPSVGGEGGAEGEGKTRV